MTFRQSCQVLAKSEYGRAFLEHYSRPRFRRPESRSPTQFRPFARVSARATFPNHGRLRRWCDPDKCLQS